MNAGALYREFCWFVAALFASACTPAPTSDTTRPRSELADSKAPESAEPNAPISEAPVTNEPDLRAVRHKTGESLEDLPHAVLAGVTDDHRFDTFVFSPEEDLLVGTGGVAMLHLWHVPDGKHLSRLRPPVLVETEYSTTGYVETQPVVAFSRDGKYLVQSGRPEELLRIFAVDERRRVKVIRGNGENTRSMLALPSGEFLLEGIDDGQTRYALPSGKRRGTLAMDGRTIGSLLVAVSDDGRRLWSYDATRSNPNGRVSLWTMQSTALKLERTHELPGVVLAVRPKADGEGSWLVARKGTTTERAFFGEVSTFEGDLELTPLEFGFPSGQEVVIDPEGRRIVDAGRSLRVADRISGSTERHVGERCSASAPSHSGRWVVLTCLLGDLDDMHTELRLVDLRALHAP